jgi:hypothetical protein
MTSVNYYSHLNDLLNQIETKLKTISDVKEVSTKLRLNDKDYLFPRIDILPEREQFFEERIHDGTRKCVFTIRVIPAIKSYDNISGADDLLELTGKVYDAIMSLRDSILHEYADDIYVSIVENYYFTGDNYILYLSSIMVICELRF